MTTLRVTAAEMRANSERWFPQLHDGTIDLVVFYGVGLVGEAGEVANVIKKRMRGEPTDSIGEELADVFTYLVLLADELGVDLVREYKRKAVTNQVRWGFPATGQPTKGATP